jgi:hypothetical protein
VECDAYRRSFTCCRCTIARCTTSFWCSTRCSDRCPSDTSSRSSAASQTRGRQRWKRVPCTWT